MTQEDGGQACHINPGFYIFCKYLLDLSGAMILVLIKQKYSFQGNQTNSDSMCSSLPTEQTDTWGGGSTAGENVEHGLFSLTRSRDVLAPTVWESAVTPTHNERI